MQVAIIGQGRYEGLQYVQHMLDGVPTIGVMPGEEYAIQFTAFEKVEYIISVDGVNVQTGRKATRYNSERFVASRGDSPVLIGWPTTNRQGQAFTFTVEQNAVATHTIQDDFALGIISIAVFTEGYVRPTYFQMHGGQQGAKGLGFDNFRGGPATGAGRHVDQHIGSADGLREPKFHSILKVRYVWAENLQRDLSQAGPTGFEEPGERRMANLGTTPIIERRPSQFRPKPFRRFE